MVPKSSVKASSTATTVSTVATSCAFHAQTPDNLTQLEGANSGIRSDEEALCEFISQLATSDVSHNVPATQDRGGGECTEADMDELIAMMRTHTISDAYGSAPQPNIYGPTSQTQPYIPATFDFSFGDCTKTSIPDTFNPQYTIPSTSHPSGDSLSVHHHHPTNTIPSTEFQFSFPVTSTTHEFTSSIPSKPFDTFIQPNQVSRQPPQPVPVTANADYMSFQSTQIPYEQYEQYIDDLDNNQQISHNDRYQLVAVGSPPHLQHRKILPLPTRRWKKKMSAGNNTLGQSSGNEAKQQPESQQYPTSSQGLPPATCTFNFEVPVPQNPFTTETDQMVSRGAGWAIGQMPASSFQQQQQQQQEKPVFGFTQEVIHDDQSAQTKSEMTSDGDNSKKKKRTARRPVVSSDTKAETQQQKQKKKWTSEDLSNAVPFQPLFPAGNFEFSVEKPASDKTIFNFNFKPTAETTSEKQPFKQLSERPAFHLGGTTIPSTTASQPVGKAAEASSGDNKTSKSAAAVPKPVVATKSKAAATTKKGKSNSKSKVEEQEPSEQVSKEASASKKGKKVQQRKKRMEEEDPYLSDVAVVRSADPNEWICLFCQYEIFCSGWEAARRKNGYFKRKKERLRRKREAESRRAANEENNKEQETVDVPKQTTKQ